MTRLRVVIFDDCADILYRLEELLQAEGADTIIFSDPYLDDVGRREIAGFKPNLIVSDWCFGEKPTDGMQLAEVLYSIPELREVPIVVISKFINGTAQGQLHKASILRAPGVVAAFGKFPPPRASELLALATADHQS